MNVILSGNLFIVVLILFSGTCDVSASNRLVINTAGAPAQQKPERPLFTEALLDEAMRRIGYEVTMNRLPAERSIINANAGIDDGEAPRVAGMENQYPNLVRVPEPIMQSNFVGFSKNPDIAIHDWDSLAPYSVGYINGWKVYESNVTAAKQIFPVKNNRQLFNLLLYDRADIVLYAEWPGLDYLFGNRVEGVSMLRPPFASVDMFLYMHQRHRDLVPRIVAELREMKADGSYQRIYERILAPLLETTP